MAVNNDWYARQFGDRDRFAVSISLGRDPHPTGDPVVDAGWGGLSIWVRGRCLTRNVSSEGAVSDEVRWSLVNTIQWLIDAGVRLINEEPFPDTTRSDNVRDACDWFNGTEIPLLTLTEAEEDAWFSRRSDWRQHHAIRRAATDAALPNVAVRRLGDSVEVSWDNETWGAPRPDLSFVEQRGTELVAAAQVASDLRAALIDATHALAERHKLSGLVELAAAASATSASDDDWRWLIHQETAHVISNEFRSLRDQLNQHTRMQRKGLYVPHTPDTLVLRQARLVSADDIKSLLEGARFVPAEPMKSPARDLIRPTPASTIRPWIEGYERARDVREALGWGDEPTPNLDAWMKSNNVSVTDRKLSSTIDLVATRTEDSRGSAVINPQTQSHLGREIGRAAALGHILFDVTPVAVDGTWEHWPTAARARAFAAMLLLPDDGVRDVLTGRTDIDASDVQRVMQRFNTGPYATTYHLKNRGFIANEERRVEILKELAA
jgi:hypothetical protein